MKQANIDFLEANYHHWITLRDAFYLRGLNGAEREGMQRVMSEEFQPGYTADLWCPSCVADMVKLLYTRYEAWKAANVQKSQEPPPQTQVIEPEPLKVKASFPNNKTPFNHGKSSKKSSKDNK